MGKVTLFAVLLTYAWILFGIWHLIHNRIDWATMSFAAAAITKP